jgi:hypothetical protein
VTIDFAPEPSRDARIEAAREEDNRRRPHGLYQPVGSRDRQRERLLEQQRAPGPRDAYGQFGLDIRRDRERDGIDGSDQLVDVGERLRTEPGRQHGRLGPIPAPDANQLRLRVCRDSRCMRGFGPVAGADQTEPQRLPAGQLIRISFLFTNSSAP